MHWELPREQAPVESVINEPFILTVAEGTDKGLSWLVDIYLGYVAVTKFSGTQRAGSNTDSTGMTCDAFAHFSLHDSEGNFVLVDIQGERKIVIHFPYPIVLQALILLGSQRQCSSISWPIVGKFTNSRGFNDIYHVF